MSGIFRMLQMGNTVAELANVIDIPAANRLGGNGVADIVVNGRLAGIAAAQKVK